ncbi:hypothetical protein QE369_003464 [Agrobacterium larrymoorei]|uniref:Tail fiber protein n=1 Tax=Agrobacterium larrymoorei TaxID=160699 RepID=A0AAJ2BE26_9HYPH|nr:hypothetical protein [Agrobacterium larrymoorei]MDR6103267.1 hypothetical protein [Agrobacterium larrymoorei]
MTVSSEVSVAGPFYGNGTTKTFPYSFKILDARHIRAVLISASGDVSDLSLDNGDYSVTGVGSETGGEVVKATPLLTGQTLTLVRRLPLTQETSLENQGAYYPEVVERRLDQMVMQIQSVKEATERSLTVEPGQEKPSMTQIAAAQGFAQGAKQSRDESAGFATAAASSAANASGSAALASRWASEAENVPVVGGLFSAFHWYRKAYGIYQTVSQGFLEKVGGILTGDVLFGPGTGGKYSKIQANGDVQLNRGDNTGYLTWNFPNAYFGWNGTDWTYGPGGKIFTAGGSIAVTNAEGYGVEYSYTGDHTFYGYMATEFGTSISAALRGFVSTQQTWAGSSVVVVAHGKPYIPKEVIVIFVCKVAFGGYAVGDRLPMPANTAARDENYAQGQGYTVNVDATNIRVNFGSDGIPYVSKGGGGVGRFGPGNFDIIVIGRP